jgi:hypothetical protein
MALISYSLDNIKLTIKSERDKTDSSITLYKMYATIPYSFKFSDYNEVIEVCEVFSTKINSSGDMTDVTIINDPSTITKLDIDTAVTAAMVSRETDLNYRNTASIELARAYNTEYAYPIEP